MRPRKRERVQRGEILPAETREVSTPTSREAKLARRRERFIRAMSMYGSMRPACEAADVPRETAYNWIRNDEAFARQVEEAAAAALERLEQEAFDRVYSGGSDTLLIFLLERAYRSKYGRQPDVALQVNQAVKVVADIDLDEI